MNTSFVDKMISWWARNPVAANMLMIGIIIAGIISFLRMEREVWPTFQWNGVEIQVAWPGASPTEIEEQVILRIEESLSDLDNIQRIRSQALENAGWLYVEANPRIDVNRFIADVKLRVDSIASFPQGLEPPRVREILTRNTLIRIAVHGNVPERDLKRASEDLRRRVALLPGAGLSELFGTRREEVSIEVSEVALQQYGLSFDEVAQAIRSKSLNAASGNVRTENGDILISTRSLADNQQDFEQIIVRQTDEGAIIRVGDIANVVDGFEDTEILATLNGEPAVLVEIKTTEQMNVVATSNAVRKFLETAEADLPEGISATLWTDDSKAYTDTMSIISSSGILGLLLVFIVLLLTMRPKVAIWVTLGIAIAFAGAFVFLPANDVSLNFLSLFAFLLVLGVVVDDAIVVGESIHRQAHIEGGGVDTAIYGAQLVAKPVIYAVLTTMLAFVPWLFLTGQEVQITRQLSIIIIAALSFSLIESLFILPAHLRKLYPRKHLGKMGKTQKIFADGILAFAQNIYRPVAIKAVQHRYLTAAAFFTFLMISFGIISSGWVKFAFDPEVEAEEISVNVELPEGTPYSRALEILRQLQRAEKTLVQEVEQRALDTGEGSGQLIENWYTRSRADSVLAIVKLAPPETRDMSAKDASERLRELIGPIPDAKDIDVRHSLNNPGPDLQFSVNHPDLNMLRLAADDLKAKLATFGAVYDVRDSFTGSTEEMRLILKPGAEKLGLTLADVSRQVRQAYYGEEVQRLPRDGTDVKVMVRYPKESRRSLDSLGTFRVRTADGRAVPLLAVADIEFVPGLKQIDRRERQRSTVVSAELKEEIRFQIIEDLEENYFPDWKKRFPGASTGAIGQAEGQAQFLSEVASLYAIALLMMFTLIAVAFRSYFLPFLILAAIPFGFMGAVYGHMILGFTMTLWSYFGIGAAVGVVVNDNLVLVDYINRLRDKAMDAREAVVEAGIVRFRPIFLTSLTTFIGLIPMMLERSTMAQFLKGTVISLSFGVAFALFVTLLFVPAMYCIGVDIGAFFKRTKGKTSAQLKPRPEPAE